MCVKTNTCFRNYYICKKNTFCQSINVKDAVFHYVSEIWNFFKENGEKGRIFISKKTAVVLLIKRIGKIFIWTKMTWSLRNKINYVINFSEI